MIKYSLTTLVIKLVNIDEHSCDITIKKDNVQNNRQQTENVHYFVVCYFVIDGEDVANPNLISIEQPSRAVRRRIQKSFDCEDDFVLRVKY